MVRVAWDPESQRGAHQGSTFAPSKAADTRHPRRSMSKTYSLKKQIPREVALLVAEELVRALPDTVIVGSLRRGCEVVGDVDLLTISPTAMNLLPMLVDQVFVKGAAKVSGRKGEIQIDLNLTTVEAMGSALMHHTGSAGFNIMCRSRALRLGYSLSQHGLFKGDQLVASATEDEILGILGMEWALDPAKRSR
jgi:DNA polymerase (family 10)